MLDGFYLDDWRLRSPLPAEEEGDTWFSYWHIRGEVLGTLMGLAAL